MVLYDKDDWNSIYWGLNRVFDFNDGKINRSIKGQVHLSAQWAIVDLWICAGMQLLTWWCAQVMNSVKLPTPDDYISNTLVIYFLYFTAWGMRKDLASCI